MGYTHYIDRPVDNSGTPEQFIKLALDAKQIIEQAKADGIRVRGGDGLGEPEFNEAFFSINGDAESFFEGRDLAHETFYWAGQPKHQEWRVGEPNYFNFCKTAYKPYDAVVTAILIRAKVIYGSCVDVRSDGDWSDWQSGRDLYEKVFGEVAECPLERAVAQ